MTRGKISYQDAGVNLDTADALVESIKARVQSTYGPAVVAGVGGYAALYDRGDGRLLASSTDGVGTKVKLAQALGVHDTIGIDLVAMCVNDLICVGARPLFFLDYLAMARIELAVLDALVAGVCEGCRQSGGIPLMGGETAEMPDVYQPGEYDLAGFVVGEVDKKDLVDGRNLRPGDTLLAFPSSGLHANGFSLVRALIRPEEKDLLREALTPTRIYWETVKDLLPLISGMAHITGGGLRKLPRIRRDFNYIVNAWPSPPPIFDVMARRSGLSDAELHVTFNMGAGLIVATSKPDELIRAAAEKPVVIGHVEPGAGRVIFSAKGSSFEI